MSSRASRLSAARSLRLLRTIAGLSQDECANRLGLPLKLIEDAESGNPTQKTLDSVLPALSLSAKSPSLSSLHSNLDEPKFTTFLLHGAWQDFRSDDLESIGRAMSIARYVYSHPDAQMASLTRHTFAPVPPAGPFPVNAAKQGHSLARRLRSALGLEFERIDDIREIAEDRLGIPVVMTSFATRKLGACSALGADRAGAVILLSPCKDIGWGLLPRVYVAHEMCHLLFDPAEPGQVQVAMDSVWRKDLTDSANAKIPALALMESRAKAFAAEFLIPLKGVEKLYGTPSAPTRSTKVASKMIQEVCAVFASPWEMTSWHLTNIGFIDWTIREDVSHHPAGFKITFDTKLPVEGELPIWLQSRGVKRESVVPPAPTAPLPSSASPPYVQEARKAKLEYFSAVDAEVIAKARGLLENEHGQMAAARFLASHIDSLLCGGEFVRVGLILNAIETDHFPPSVLSGILSITWLAKDHLAEFRKDFAGRCKATLTEKMEFDQEKVFDLIGRFE